MSMHITVTDATKNWPEARNRLCHLRWALGALFVPPDTVGTRVWVELAHVLVFAVVAEEMRRACDALLPDEAMIASSANLA